jgi:hypothetical protein
MTETQNLKIAGLIKLFSSLGFSIDKVSHLKGLTMTLDFALGSKDSESAHFNHFFRSITTEIFDHLVEIEEELENARKHLFEPEFGIREGQASKL